MALPPIQDLHDIPAAWFEEGLCKSPVDIIDEHELESELQRSACTGGVPSTAQFTYEKYTFMMIRIHVRDNPSVNMYYVCVIHSTRRTSRCLAEWCEEQCKWKAPEINASGSPVHGSIVVVKKLLT